ncbi:hypothetical protein KSS87_019257 [Heliosperma pusillum]|nr:hypothetical protein KSS87_019257 [Heliosperma pusillum]
MWHATFGYVRCLTRDMAAKVTGSESEESKPREVSSYSGNSFTHSTDTYLHTYANGCDKEAHGLISAGPDNSELSQADITAVRITAATVGRLARVINNHQPSEISGLGPHNRNHITKIKRAEKGSDERADAEKELADVISHRKHIDDSMRAIVKALVVNGHINDTMSSRLLTVSTKAYTWDWKCFKSIVAKFRAHCGTLRVDGVDYNQLFANLCDAGVTPDQLAVASLQTCPSHTVNPKWMAEVKV